MNKTKSLTKTFLVAIFAFAMMFAGVSFVMPQKTTDVYATGESTTYTVTIGSNNKPSWSNGVVPSEMKSGDCITITLDGCDEYNDGQIFVDSVSEKQISGNTGTISYTATKNYTVSTHGSKGDMLYYVYLTTKVSGYTITYDANGATSGTVPTDTTSYAENASVTVLDNTGSLTKDGYIFSGWNTKDDGTGNDYTVGSTYTMGTSNVTLYAKWTPISYNITYNLDGGTNNSNNPATYNIKTAIITLADPTKNGCAFVGWFSDDTFSTQVMAIAQGSTGDKTLYAKWVNYIYTYSEISSSWDKSSETSYKQGDKIIFKDIYTGFSLFSYSINVNGIDTTSVSGGSSREYTVVNNGATIELCTSPKVVVNIIDVPSYTITYNLNNGTNDSNNPATYTQYTETITLANPTRTGYKFLGWYDNSGFAGSAITQIAKGSTGNKEFFAKWEEKTTININTSIQRMIYDGNAKTPTLKDTNGDTISLSGFNYSYQMYQKIDYADCSDTKDPGLYKVYITRAEDDEYQAVEKDIEFVVTYSLTYKANTGVGDDIIDNADDDTIHKDYFGPYCESDPDTYYFDKKATIKTNTFTKENYTFAFWNTKQDGTGTSYNPRDLVTLTGNTTLYACYSANISGQPIKNNNYTVSVATTDSVTYQWEKQTVNTTEVDLTKITTDPGTINTVDKSITAVKPDGSSTYKIIILCTDRTKSLMFNTTGVLNESVVGKNNTYIYSPVGGLKAKFYIITSNSPFTITNMYYYNLEYNAISDETTNSIINANENSSYRCIVTSKFNAVIYSDVITPKAISFAGGDGATGTAPSALYQLEGRTITIPANTFTKTGYKFLGWNTDKNATTAISNTYTVTDSDVTLYAIWQEKDKLSVSYTALDNTHTYDKTGHGFDGKLIFGQSDILINNIKYASHIDGTHADSDWSTTAPINAGTYDIKIYRAEDSTYAEYNEVTKSAIVINQKELGLSWDNLYEDYTGSEIKPTCTLTGICVGDECTVEVTGGKINIGLEYVATATNLSNPNYKLPTKHTTNFNINIPLTITRTEYNKKQQEVIVNTTDEIKNTFTFEYKLTTEDDSKYTTTKPINAGLYVVRISRAASEDHNEYVSEQPNMLEIYKKELTYSWTNTRFIYDGSPHLPTVAITNLESGDVCNLTITGTQTDYSESSYYAIVESCDNPNYDITSSNKHTFNIYPETLYYNIETGKLVYINEAETEFVATAFNDYYSVSKDHKTLTLKNINHVLNYNAGAFTIDTRVTSDIGFENRVTERLTIVLEGTNNLGCSTSGGYGVTFYGDVTIKGDGILNISGQFFLNDATEITSNLLTVESGTINVEIISDTEKEKRVSFLAENTLNIYGGKITVNNPLKINTLFGFRNGNFLLYVSQDKNTQLSLISKVDYDTEEGRYISEHTVGANTTKYYYAELRPLIIAQEPSVDNDVTIQTNIDSTYQWYVTSEDTFELTEDDINELTSNYKAEYSYDDTKGSTFSAEGKEVVFIFVAFNNTEYTTVTFTSNEELSFDFSGRDAYSEFSYNLLSLIKEEKGVYYYKAGLVFAEDEEIGIIKYFTCCLVDETDLTMEINNVCFITDVKKIDGATSSSYETPTQTGDYYVVAKSSFATVKSQTLTATKITYDVNSGNGSVDSIIKFVGTTITLDDGSSLSKNGCGFVGWNTDKNATSAISNTYIFTDSDVILYAIWAEKETPTVTAPTAKTLTYTGSLIDLINAGTTTGGTIQYSLGTITASNSYSSNLPQGKDAGTYYVWYKVVGNTYYFDVAEVCITVTINKLTVNEPTVVGTYKYTGNAQTVILNGKENYMTTTNSLTQTNVGIYTIHFTLDNNHEWATGSDGIITWEIRAASISPKLDDTTQQGNKQKVIVETEDGFSSDISVIVEVTVETEIEQKELSVDYYNLEDEAKLSNNEKVGIVFNVKLIQTIGGVSQEIQPSDIKAGTKIKVKMLIPETVDISKVTRILHIHSAGDIEEIEFDASKVDENGYYEIEIDRLSEFAFIYQTGNQNTLIICVLGGLGLLLIALLLALFLKKKKSNCYCQ